MDIDSLTDDELDELASKLAGRLPTGRHGDKIVTTRRQLLSIAGGSAGVAGLTALGIDPATAQSAAGQVGAQSSPEDVFAYNLDVQNGAEFNGSDVTGVGSLSTGDISLTNTPSEFFLPWELVNSKTADSNPFELPITADATTYLIVFDDVSIGAGYGPSEMRMRWNNDATLNYRSWMVDGTVYNRDHYLLHETDTQPFSGVMLVNAEGGCVRPTLAHRYDRAVLDYGATANEIDVGAGDSLTITNTPAPWESGTAYVYSLGF